MNRGDRLFLEVMFLMTLAAFSLAFLRLMQPFLLTVFLALVLANVFGKPFRWLERHSGGRRQLAAGLTLVLVFVVVALPLTLVVTLVTTELTEVLTSVRQNWSQSSGALGVRQLAESIRAVPVAGTLLERFPDFDLETTLREFVTTSSDYLLRLSQSSLGNVAGAVISFILMLLLIYFMLADGSRVVGRLYDTIPIANAEIDQIVGETFNTTSATLISTIIIGLMEGALATALFVIFSLPSPVLWGVITMVLSMIPLIGTNLVLIPAGLLAILGGRIAAGAIIISAGAVGVAITQNVIKPKLLGDRTGLHPAVALLATLGGIAWLGLIGFLIGPVLASLFIVVWRQFSKRYRRLLEAKDGDGATEPETIDPDG